MLEIDLQNRAGRISPLWFGHNLEHTRSCLWGGLSAQLIRNRKFVGAMQPDGVALGWRRVGPAGCQYLLERSGGKRGAQGTAFTSHFDPADLAGCGRQMIRSFSSGFPRGISQRGLCVIGGREYEARLALLSDRAIPVRIRLGAQGSGREWFQTIVTVSGAEWTQQRFSFPVPATEPDACLEITFDVPGTLWVGAASLMPANHFHGMRPDVIALLREIGVPILRWPGGNFAGSYIWQDGLLPVDRRAPLAGGGILPHTGGHDDHEIGTDEFVALCRELGAEPWITINMGLEAAAEQAAAWVEYCNGAPDTAWGKRRAERGHPRPYNVKHWSLGNEIGWPHMKGPKEPRQYAAAAIACAKAMRKADPSIVLVASDGPARQEWCTGVAAEAGHCIEHVSYHQYTDFMKVYEGEEGRSEFRRVAGAASENLRAMRQMRAWLDSHAPARRPIGISFDEWNVWYAWFRRPGVVEGIHAAAMLNMFCREAQKVGMSLGAYFQPVNEGAILVTPETCRLTPAGEVFALFRAHHGNELLEVGAPADADLDVAASVNEAGREVILTLVSLSPDRDEVLRIRLKNVGGIVGASGSVLTCPNFLPESVFAVEPLEVKPDGDVVAVRLPRHGVARVRVTYH